MKKINFLILMGIAATQASFTAHADNSDGVNTMNDGVSEKRDDAKGYSVWKKKVYDTVKKHMKGHHMGNITPEMFEQKAQDITSELIEDPEMRDRLTNHVKKMVGERLEKKNLKYLARMNEQFGADKLRF
jgi:hypothetical protein